MSAVSDDISPWQRARMLAAAEAVRSGRVTFPLRCGYDCRSTSLYDEYDELHAYARTMKQRPGDDPIRDQVITQKRGTILTCHACGRRTTVKAAKKVRMQEIKAFIRAGIDPPMA